MGIFDNQSDPAFQCGRAATATAKPFSGIAWHHTRDAPMQNMVDYGKTVDAERGGAFGYHFYFGKDGRVVQGAPLDKRTNHVKPGSSTGLTNSNAIGISLVGAENGATPKQIAAARTLGKEIEAKYGIAPKANFGHGEMQGDRQAHEGQEMSRYMRGDDIADEAMVALGYAPKNNQPTHRISTRNAPAGSRQQDRPGAAQMENEQTGLLAPNAQKFFTPERMGALAMGLAGMSLNPNRGVMARGASMMQQGREDRRSNQTAQWLKGNVAMMRGQRLPASLSGRRLTRPETGPTRYALTPRTA
jgi:hypothetical protein